MMTEEVTPGQTANGVDRASTPGGEQKSDEHDDVLVTVLRRIEEKLSLGGGNGGGPWWSKTVWQMGPLAVGFILMLLIMGGLIDSPIQKIPSLERAAEAHTETLRNHGVSIEDIKTTMRDFLRFQEVQIRLQRVTCRNVAKTETSAENCDR